MTELKAVESGKHAVYTKHELSENLSASTWSSMHDERANSHAIAKQKPLDEIGSIKMDSPYATKEKPHPVSKADKEFYEATKEVLKKFKEKEAHEHSLDPKKGPVSVEKPNEVNQVKPVYDPGFKRAPAHPDYDPGFRKAPTQPDYDKEMNRPSAKEIEIHNKKGESHVHHFPKHSAVNSF